MANENKWYGGNNRQIEFLDTSAEDVTEDEILDYLAGIICDIYIKQLEAEQQQKQASEQQ